MLQLKTFKEIGQDLNIAERTAKFHAANIYRKAGIPHYTGKGKFMLLLRQLGNLEASMKWVLKP